MAGRSRTNVYANTTYEDFKTQVDLKEEQGAYILIINLPGFPKEQIRINYVDSTRTIKVETEKVISKNRRSRFNQTFIVPQDCNTEKLQGNFRKGVLTITMPKNTITQVASVKDADTTKETTTPPKPIEEQKPMEDKKETTPPKADSTITEPKAPMETGPQNAPPKAQTNRKKIESLQPSKQQEETQKKAAPIATTNKQMEEETAGSSTAEIIEKKAESPVGLKDLVKEKENGKTKDSSMSESNIPKISEKGKKDDKAGGALEEKPKEGGNSFLEKAKEMTTTKKTEEEIAGSSTTEIVEKKAESPVGLKDLVKEKENGKTKDSSMFESNIPKISEKGKKDDKAGGALEEKPKEGGSSFLEKAKEMKGMDTIMKTVKRLATDDYEDRQLLINIGVSVLVVVALGAYITYSYRSSGKAKD